MEKFLDIAVVFIYILAVFWVAYRSKGARSENEAPSLKSHYLANGSLTFSESLFSMAATETSALTFLGVPAIAFKTNFSILDIYFGALFGRLIIAYWLLPKIYGQGLTLYQVMANLSGERSGQVLTSGIYILSKILAIGVRLFSGSILISVFFKIPIPWAIIITTIITFLYTLNGGLKAVVRTDILQYFILLFGGVLSFFLIPWVSDLPFESLHTLALENGKMNLFSAGGGGGFLMGILGGILFDFATHGADQDFIQRMLANRNLKSAQKAMIVSSLFSLGMGTLFLYLGALLWAHYFHFQNFHSIPEPDKVFAHFIITYFPAGVVGLMMASVLAATMSTVDSCINSLSSCLSTDIFPKRETHRIGFYIRLDNILITTLLILVALWASHSQSMLILGLQIQSWTLGGILSLVIVCILKNPPLPLSLGNAFFALLGGGIGVWLNQKVLLGHWVWNIAWSLIVSFFFLALFFFSKKFLNKRLKR